MKKYFILPGFFVVLMIGLVGCSDYTLDEGKLDGTTKADSIKTRGVDVDFHDVTVTSNRTVSGDNVIARNVTVNDNVQLTLQATQKVSIQGYFKVNSKSKLILKR